MIENMIGSRKRVPNAELVSIYAKGHQYSLDVLAFSVDRDEFEPDFCRPELVCAVSREQMLALFEILEAMCDQTNTCQFTRE